MRLKDYYTECPPDRPLTAGERKGRVLSTTLDSSGGSDSSDDSDDEDEEVIKEQPPPIATPVAAATSNDGGIFDSDNSISFSYSDDDDFIPDFMNSNSKRNRGTKSHVTPNDNVNAKVVQFNGIGQEQDNSSSDTDNTDNDWSSRQPVAVPPNDKPDWLTESHDSLNNGYQYPTLSDQKEFFKARQRRFASQKDVRRKLSQDLSKPPTISSSSSSSSSSHVHNTQSTVSPPHLSPSPSHNSPHPPIVRRAPVPSKRMPLFTRNIPSKKMPIMEKQTTVTTPKTPPTASSQGLTSSAMLLDKLEAKQKSKQRSRNKQKDKTKKPKNKTKDSEPQKQPNKPLPFYAQPTPPPIEHHNVDTIESSPSPLPPLTQSQNKPKHSPSPSHQPSSPLFLSSELFSTGGDSDIETPKFDIPPKTPYSGFLETVPTTPDDIPIDDEKSKFDLLKNSSTANISSEPDNIRVSNSQTTSLSTKENNIVENKEEEMSRRKAKPKKLTDIERFPQTHLYNISPSPSPSPPPAPPPPRHSIQQTTTSSYSPYSFYRRPVPRKNIQNILKAGGMSSSSDDEGSPPPIEPPRLLEPMFPPLISPPHPPPLNDTSTIGQITEEHHGTNVTFVDIPDDQFEDEIPVEEPVAQPVVNLSPEPTPPPPPILQESPPKSPSPPTPPLSQTSRPIKRNLIESDDDDEKETIIRPPPKKSKTNLESIISERKLVSTNKLHKEKEKQERKEKKKKEKLKAKALETVKSNRDEEIQSDKSQYNKTTEPDVPSVKKETVRQTQDGKSKEKSSF